MQRSGPQGEDGSLVEDVEAGAWASVCVLERADEGRVPSRKLWSEELAGKSRATWRLAIGLRFTCIAVLFVKNTVMQRSVKWWIDGWVGGWRSRVANKHEVDVELGVHWCVRSPYPSIGECDDGLRLHREFFAVAEMPPVVMVIQVVTLFVTLRQHRCGKCCLFPQRL